MFTANPVVTKSMFTKLLRQRMEDISEDSYAATWMENLSSDVWTLCLLMPLDCEYGMSSFSGDDLQDILSLAVSGGVWIGLEGDVDLSAWCAEFGASHKQLPWPQWSQQAVSASLSEIWGVVPGTLEEAKTDRDGASIQMRAKGGWEATAWIGGPRVRRVLGDRDSAARWAEDQLRKMRSTIIEQNDAVAAHLAAVASNISRP